MPIPSTCAERGGSELRATWYSISYPDLGADITDDGRVLQVYVRPEKLLPSLPLHVHRQRLQRLQHDPHHLFLQRRQLLLRTLLGRLQHLLRRQPLHRLHVHGHHPGLRSNGLRLSSHQNVPRSDHPRPGDDPRPLHRQLLRPTNQHPNLTRGLLDDWLSVHLPGNADHLDGTVLLPKTKIIHRVIRQKGSEIAGGNKGAQEIRRREGDAPGNKIQIEKDKQGAVPQPARRPSCRQSLQDLLIYSSLVILNKYIHR